MTAEMMILAFIFMVFCLTIASLTAMGNNENETAEKAMDVFEKLINTTPKIFLKGIEEDSTKNELLDSRKNSDEDKSLEDSS